MSIRDYVEKKFIQAILGAWTGDKFTHADHADEQRDVVVLVSQLHIPIEVRKSLTLQQHKELNEGHLLAAINAVDASGGDVHIIMPNSILSIFNAWNYLEGPLEKAFIAARELLKNRKLLSACENKDKRISIGMGLAAGPMLVGVIGNSRRKQVTVFGDPAVAACELANNAIHKIFISKPCYEKLVALKMIRMGMEVDVCSETETGK